MRIIGYIQHPSLKITVFQTDTRIILKFENAHFEQSYKLRRGDQFANLEDAKKLVDEQFLEQVHANFNAMGKTILESFRRNVKK